MEHIYKITSKFSFVALIAIVIGFELFGSHVANSFYNLPVAPETAMFISSRIMDVFMFAEKVFIALLLVKVWNECYRTPK